MTATPIARHRFSDSSVPTASTSCAAGQHRPNRARAVEQDGITRTFCRDCRCDLVRTQASRRWFRSGIFS